MKKEEGIMLSIRKPYTDMIFSGEKPFEFRTRLIKSVKPGAKLYIYETKNGGGAGKVVGEAETNGVFDSLGAEASLTLYEHYVKLTGDKTPMFVSHFFAKYKEKIGWTVGNKAIWLCNVVKYAQPRELTEFAYLNGKAITHPPQGMCGCMEKGEDE